MAECGRVISQESADTDLPCQTSDAAKAACVQSVDYLSQVPVL